MTVRCVTRRMIAVLAVLTSLLVTGCAGVLPQVERVPSRTLVAAPETALPAAVQAARLPEGASGVWPLLQATYALDARLALIDQASTSIDLQYYLVADDPTGRTVLRALRDAALRGVRVRLLVDDLYTTDIDHLLLGLAATPNVEVRLFNPFVTARDSSLRRLLALASDFKRLNHRMHNKLFIADGTMAIVGGRNLADEYFLRGAQNNFIDFDLMAAGAVVNELNQWFDLYWNSTQAYPVQAITQASGRAAFTADELRSRFDAVTRVDARPEPPTDLDAFGAPPLHAALAQRRVSLVAAESSAYADSPNKVDPDNHSLATSDTLTHRFLLQLSDARTEAHLFSPYFIPGAETLERIRTLRESGVPVRVVTNSLAVSDEPLVSIGLERHQVELLKMGVELYEISSTRLKLNRDLRTLLGSSTGRLHAKLGVIDRQIVMVGSMNLDPRSATLNTEIGVRVFSPQLAEMVLGGFKVDELAGVYQVKLRPHGSGVRWIAVDGDTTHEVDVDPDTSLWQRVRLMLMSWFVPENQL
jgi:phosphatidylserine/phosphatidylglycerophosphate/cardiolipin synthase-like enzyme